MRVMGSVMVMSQADEVGKKWGEATVVVVVGTNKDWGP